MKPYLVLLRVEFTLQLLLPAIRCALTAPFQPYLFRKRSSAVFSLLHLSSAHAAQALPGTLLIGARTFLPSLNKFSKQRLSSQLEAHSTCSSPDEQGSVAMYAKQAFHPIPLFFDENKLFLKT